VIATEELFRGTLTQTSVYPREVVKLALQHNAAAVIFAHNHPSGIPEPSPEDIAITKRIAKAASLMDIIVHDHIIIGHNTYTSLKDQGYLSNVKAQ